MLSNLHSKLVYLSVQLSPPRLKMFYLTKPNIGHWTSNCPIWLKFWAQSWVEAQVQLRLKITNMIIWASPWPTWANSRPNRRHISSEPKAGPGKGNNSTPEPKQRLAHFEWLIRVWNWLFWPFSAIFSHIWWPLMTPCGVPRPPLVQDHQT